MLSRWAAHHPLLRKSAHQAVFTKFVVLYGCIKAVNMHIQLYIGYLQYQVKPQKYLAQTR